MDKLEKRTQAADVFVLDVQAPEGSVYNNEMHVFSNQDACKKFFVEIYGQRILDWPFVISASMLENKDAIEDKVVGDSENHEHISLSEDKLFEEALFAYGRAFGNINGLSIYGHTFRVLQRNIVVEADGLF